MRIRKRNRLTILLISSLCLPLNDLVDASESVSEVRSRGNLTLSPQQQQQRRRTQATGATCIGTSLYPSQILYTNEFLCRNSLRFGIDDSGRLLLGIASEEGAATPSAVLWEAPSTSLFVRDSPFSRAELSPDGSLLGYDADGIVVYDSNSDYDNRLDGKVAGSALSLSSECERGETCVRIASPAAPGAPYGDVTWGVVNRGVEAASAGPAPSPSADPAPPPSAIPPTESPSASPVGTPSPSFEPTLSPPSEPEAYIWGSLWTDSDSDGTGEEPIGGAAVRLYECESSAAVETKITDSRGWYFFRVEEGKEYRAKFDVDPAYEFTSGVDAASEGGWTECRSPTVSEPVQWNATLHLSPSSAPFVEKPAPNNSQMGGAIFIDLNGDGVMDSVEEKAVERGYVVSDAVVQVSVHDCVADSAVRSQEVEFPGKYLFEGLREGLYKVEFDIVLVNKEKQNKDSKLPLYSFYDEEEGNTSSFETNCINLPRDAANLSVHAGIRIPKVKVNTKVSDDLDVKGEETTSEKEEVVQNAVLSVEEASPGGEKKTSVAGVVVGALAALGLAVASALFVWKKKQIADNDASVMSSMCASLKEAAMDSLIVEFGGPVDFAEEEEGESSGKDDGDGRSRARGDRADDDALNTNADAAEETVVELDKQFQLNPYHPNASSIFESESLDSDPYIYTGDEHSDGSSDPYIYPGDERGDNDTGPYIYTTGDTHTDYSKRTGRKYESGIPQSQKAGSHAASWDRGNHPLHYCRDESSVVSNRSADPPAASYRNLPAASYDYRTNDEDYYASPNSYQAATEDYYNYSSANTYQASHMTAAKDFHRNASNNDGSSDVDQANEQSVTEDRCKPNNYTAPGEDLGASLNLDDLSYESEESSSSRSSSSSSSNSYNDSNRSKSAPPGRPHAGWTHDSFVPEYESNNYPISQGYVGSIVDDQSVISSQSDHSADPPGASYQTLGSGTSYRSAPYRTSGHGFTPPPPRRPFRPPPPPRR